MRARSSLAKNAVAAAVGVVADLVFGEPALEPHPVSAFGTVMGRVERRLYRPRRSPGVLHTATGLGIGIAAGSVVRSTALATYISVAQRALREAGRDVAEALRDDDLVRARGLLPALVGRDPSGLDASGHGMSAHDLAHVAAYLDKYYPQLAAIAGTKDVSIPATTTHKAFYPANLNRLLWTYPGATGLKTGLTDNAGGCMLATATRNGRHLVAVVLNATGYSVNDAILLLNYGFSVHPRVTLWPVPIPAS